MAEGHEAIRRTPSDFIRDAIGQEVTVRIHTGSEFRGSLLCLDGFMNIAMKDTTEWRDGHEVESYGDAFVRGNNVMYIRLTS